MGPIDTMMDSRALVFATVALCVGLAAAEDPASSWLAYTQYTATDTITLMNVTRTVPEYPTDRLGGPAPGFWFGVEDTANMVSFSRSLPTVMDLRATPSLTVSSTGTTTTGGRRSRARSSRATWWSARWSTRRAPRRRTS